MSNRILSIKGIFLKDLDNIIDLNKNQSIIYDKIPFIFESKDVDKWCKKCNLRCMNCTLTIDNTPYFIPSDIKTDKNNIVFTRSKEEGLYCSPFCAQRFICDTYPKHLHLIKSENLVRLYNFIHSKNVIGINPFYNRYMLEAYGGTMPESEFKLQLKNSKNLLIE